MKIGETKLRKFLISIALAIGLFSGSVVWGQSAGTKEFRLLYLEIQAFQDADEFKKFGFSPAGPYKQWQVKVEKLDESSDEIFDEIFVLPGDLLILGLEYMRDANGRGDEAYINFMETEIANGLRKFNFE